METGLAIYTVVACLMSESSVAGQPVSTTANYRTTTPDYSDDDDDDGKSTAVYGVAIGAAVLLVALFVVSCDRKRRKSRLQRHVVHQRDVQMSQTRSMVYSVTLQGGSSARFNESVRQYLSASQAGSNCRAHDVSDLHNQERPSDTFTAPAQCGVVVDDGSPVATDRLQPPSYNDATAPSALKQCPLCNNACPLQDAGCPHCHVGDIPQPPSYDEVILQSSVLRGTAYALDRNY